MKSLSAVTAENPTNQIFLILINAATVAIQVKQKFPSVIYVKTFD